MSVSASSCLSQNELLQKIGRAMPADEVELLASHLESCATCASLVDQFLTQDTLSEALRSRETLSDPPSRAVIETLIRRLRTLPEQANRSHSQATKDAVSVPPESVLRSAAAAAGIRLSCACGKTLLVKGEWAGKKVRCPGCKQVLQAPAAGADTIQRETPTIAPVGSPAGPSTSDSANDEHFDFLAPPLGPDEIGWLGNYRILKVLGAGGMGVVFQAEDPKLKRQVALKAMLPALAASASAGKRFLREAQAIAAIKHDHIVTIYQVGEDRGVPFLAMEFLDGEPLDKRLERDSQLPLIEILRICREITAGLGAAHERGLIHRDIKPGNIWLEGKRARVKILDFGLARASSEESNLTQQGVILGTPSHMAPEQAAGQPVDHRCDLFSLGVVLYRLTTGRLPFRGNDTISTLMAVATEDPPAPIELVPAIPKVLSDLVMKLLAKNPNDRFETAQRVMEAIAAVEADINPATPPAFEKIAAATPRPQGTRGKSRRRWPLLVGGMFVAACILAAILLIRVETPEGEFQVQVEDDSVALALNKRGGLTLIDRRTGRKFNVEARKAKNLPAGQYDLVVTEADSGFAFSAREFTILGKENPTAVKVSFKPKESNPQATLPNPGPSVKPSTPNPFDALRHEDIPLEERKLAGDGEPIRAPRDLVGVFGVRGNRYCTDVFVTHDGKRLYLGINEPKGSLQVYDTATGKVLPNPLPNKFLYLSLSGNGRQLAALVRTSGPLHLLDPTTGQLLGTVPLQRASHYRLVSNVDGSLIASITTDKNVQDSIAVYDTVKGALLYTLKTPDTFFSDLRFSPDGKHLATYTLEGRVALWKARTGEEVRKFDTLKKGLALAFSPEGTRLVLHSHGNPTEVLDAQTGEAVAAIKGSCRSWPGTGTPFSPDGRWLVGTDFGQIVVWDAATGIPRKQWSVPGASVQGVSFAPDGRHVLVCNQFGQVYVLRWTDAPSPGPSTPTETKTPNPGPATPFDTLKLEQVDPESLRMLGWEERAKVPSEIVGVFGDPRLTHRNAVDRVEFSPDGKWILSSENGNDSRVWDAETGKLHKLLPVNTATFTPENLVANSGGDHRPPGIYFYDPVADKDVGMIGPGKHARYLKYSAQGDRFLVVNSDGVQVWDVREKRPISTMEAGEYICHALSVDGRTVAGLFGDGHVHLWDANTGKRTRILKERQEMPGGSSIVFHPQRNELVVTSSASDARIWDLKTETIRAKFRPWGYWFGGVAYAPDGKTIAGGGHTSLLHLFDADTGQVVRTFPAKDAETTKLDPNAGRETRCVAFSPDGKRLASGCHDGKIHLWDVATGTQLPVSVGPGKINVVAIRPDGQQIAAAHHDGLVRLWDVAQRRITRTLESAGFAGVALRYSPDGRHLFVANGVVSKATLWDLNAPERPLFEHQKFFHGTDAAFSPNGKSVFAASSDGGVFQLEVPSGKELNHFGLGVCSAVAAAPDGKRIAIAYVDGKSSKHHVSVLDGESEEVLWKSPELVGLQIRHLRFTPQGDRLLGTSTNGPNFIWDSATGKELASPKAWILDVTSSGTAWGIFPENGLFQIDVQTGKKLGRISYWPFNGATRDYQVHDRLLAVTPDGRYAVQGCLHGLLVIEKLE